MKAMILAAGKGTRMRPLTNHTPKPLLNVGGKPLIVHHLERLAKAGFNDVVINVAYLGEKIMAALGNGKQWGLHIQYSQEHQPLETAGGILHAQVLLGDEPFCLINGDIWTDYPLENLRSKTLSQNTLGHLVLVNNPEHNPTGDFGINNNGKLTNQPSRNYTFSGLSVINPELIKHYSKKRESFPLGEVFRNGIKNNVLTAEYYEGEWIDVGTVERLQAIDEQYQNNTK